MTRNSSQTNLLDRAFLRRSTTTIMTLPPPAAALTVKPLRRTKSARTWRVSRLRLDQAVPSTFDNTPQHFHRALPTRSLSLSERSRPLTYRPNQSPEQSRAIDAGCEDRGCDRGTSETHTMKSAKVLFRCDRS